MNQRWPRCRTGNNATADAPSPATLRVCDLERSEALRARQALWRAVFDSPSPAARFPASRLRRRVCFVPDQTSSASTLGSEADSVAPPRPSRVRRTAQLQQVLLPTHDITGFLD